jgi:hypothetical protein
MTVFRGSGADADRLAWPHILGPELRGGSIDVGIEAREANRCSASQHGRAVAGLFHDSRDNSHERPISPSRQCISKAGIWRNAHFKVNAIVRWASGATPTL